jgi:Acetyltransferase (GNAT) domain
MHMASYRVRTLRPDDLAALAALAQDIQEAGGEPPHSHTYLGLCCDLFADSCFIAHDGDVLVGHLLCFLHGRAAYCTTIGIRPDYAGTRVLLLLLRSFVAMLGQRADTCWFSARKDDLAARHLHRMLGARDVSARRDFPGHGDDHVMSRLDRHDFDRLQPRYARLGLLELGGARVTSDAA